MRNSPFTGSSAADYGLHLGAGGLDAGRGAVEQRHAVAGAVDVAHAEDEVARIAPGVQDEPIRRDPKRVAVLITGVAGGVGALAATAR